MSAKRTWGSPPPLGRVTAQCPCGEKLTASWDGIRPSLALAAHTLGWTWEGDAGTGHWRCPACSASSPATEEEGA